MTLYIQHSDHIVFSEVESEASGGGSCSIHYATAGQRRKRIAYDALGGYKLPQTVTIAKDRPTCRLPASQGTPKPAFNLSVARQRWRALVWSSLLLTLPASASQISLAWNDNSSNETSFKIERALADLAFTQVATVGANVSVYTDSTVSASTAYWYRVRASNASGNSAYSNVITATAPSASNTAPVISNIANQTISGGGNTGALAFTVSDAQTAAGSLVVTGASSNTALVPTSSIVLGGSGSSRTVTVTPASGQTGTATITVTVSDGALTAADTFVLTVSGTNSSATFSNPAVITISDAGAATPYPSTITVGGMSGTLTNVTVRLINFNQEWSKDVDVLLVSPTGQKLLLMSDAGTGSTTNATFSFSDAAAGSLPASGSLVSGTYKPTNYDTTTDAFAAPAPAAPYAATLAAFNGQNPNGPWSLYVMDDDPAVGNFAGGWSITLTTNATANTPPTITTVANQTIASGGTTGALAFTVGDAQTTAGTLTVVGGSSNTALVPVANIIFGGSGANRTVTVSPVAGQSGTTTITLTVSDGALTTSTSFSITVTSSNTAPVISNIANTTIGAGSSTGALAFTVSDAQTAAGSLVVTGASSNTSLVPNSSIVFGGSGSNRTVSVTPAAAQTGTATITVTVSDGALAAADTFVLTVSAATTSATFSNPAVITIPTLGAATPYPATITVGGMSGTMTNVTVRLIGFHQEWVKDVDVLLVSPTGQKLLLMSDVGWGSTTNATFTFSDAAAGSLPASGSLVSGTYKPTNYDTTTDAFAAPAPAGPYATTLATFNGQNPNGAWSLYVMDDEPAVGNFAGGWSITITTGASGPLPSPWLTADIGSTGATGSAAHSNGVYTVQGAGILNGTTDSLRFAYQTLSGDGEIRARVFSEQNTSTGARAGVMIRESLNNNSAHATMNIAPNGTFRFERRSATGAASSSTTGSIGTFPNTWVRLLRSGTTFTAYSSPDGASWTQVGSSTITMASTIYVGVAVASGSNGTLNTSVLDNVTVVP